MNIVKDVPPIVREVVPARNVQRRDRWPVVSMTLRM